MVVFSKMETHIVKSRASFQHTSKPQVQKAGHKKEVGCLSLRPMLAAERVPVNPCLSWDFLQEQQHPSHMTYLLVQEIPGVQLTGPGEQQQVGVNQRSYPLQNYVFKNMPCSLAWLLKLTVPGPDSLVSFIGYNHLALPTLWGWRWTSNIHPSCVGSK